jgi:hypothetical protein
MFIFDMTYASIPYNPDNELHQMLAGDRTDLTGSRIQLAMTSNSDDPRARAYRTPELNLSFVSQMAEAVA